MGGQVGNGYFLEKIQSGLSCLFMSAFSLYLRSLYTIEGQGSQYSPCYLPGSSHRVVFLTREGISDSLEEQLTCL